MRALVCSVPCRLRVQNFAHLQVASFLSGDAGCCSIRLAFFVSPASSSTIGCEPVYESIAALPRTLGILAGFFKNF
jgi:hypothetical protein